MGMRFGVISPQDWGLPVGLGVSEQLSAAVGVSPAELARRVRANTYEWLLRQFDEQAGAFYGYYSALLKRFEPPQTVNLIAAWQLLAAHDRFQDESLLSRARRAAEWFYQHFVATHPMSIALGGVREGGTPEGMRSPFMWTKFTAEFVILNAGLYRRAGDPVHLERARQSAGFLIQSARHDFAPRYNELTGEWYQRGWQSFGRAVEAFLELEQVAGEADWRAQAVRWGEFGLSLQAPDGAFYLMDGEYFNTDLAPDELRALVFLYELTGQERYQAAARRFADWLLARQLASGAWPLTIDPDGNVVVTTVGPGDVPNLAISLLRLHAATSDKTYLEAALRALRYSLSTQATPGSAHPYLDDDIVRWGFWSWDPYYDFTLSADQSTHHARGMMFLLDLGLLAA
jgi:hypothetical protein